MSDEPTLHNHPWNWGALIVKGGYWEHTPNGKFWRGPGSFRFRKSEDLHYLELAKDKDGKKMFSLEDKLALMHKVDSDVLSKVAVAMVQTPSVDELKKKS